jgi:uncharacterized protein (TIGR02246 family)
MRVHNPRVLLLLAPVIWACSTPPAPDAAEKASAPADNVADVKKAIEDANAKFLDALAKGDAASAAGNYADDAILMMPNEAAMSGHQAIVDGFTKFVKDATISNGKPLTSDVQVSGDLAVETGTFEWTITPKGGKPMTDKGKYLTVWKKQADGNWKIIRDMNNSDLAAGK